MHTNETIKNVIDELIQAGTTFDISALDKIYHDQLQVIMIDEESNVNLANKDAFKQLFEAKKTDNSAPLNTWAEYNNVSIKENTAHVLITRKVNLMGIDQKLILSIDLIMEDDRWQVIREVIFVKNME